MKRLKQWLTKHEVSQAAFAELVGVKQPTVSEWLSGEMNPRASKFADISKQTGIPIEDLIADCAKPSPKRVQKQAH